MTTPKIEFRALDDLPAYARNARTHSDDQVAQLMGAIIEFGWTNPVLADGNGIVAGHGRCMAARKLYTKGKTIKLPSGDEIPAGTVPVIDCTGWSEAKRRAYILADNKLAMNAGWDFDMLSVELDDLNDMEYDLSLLGFSQDELNELIGNPNSGLGDNDGLDGEYTKKITIPVYEPKGEKPELSTLSDLTKYKQLLAEIESADIDEGEKEFLKYAASRHVVFDYQQIAEYYCHANPDVQDLIEKSALVLIDFDKAVENGYVQMTKKLECIFAEAYGDDDEE
jgi:hypothetical protein